MGACLLYGAGCDLDGCCHCDCRLPVLAQQDGRCKAQVGQPWLLPMIVAEMQQIVEGVAVKVMG